MTTLRCLLAALAPECRGRRTWPLVTRRRYVADVAELEQSVYVWRALAAAKNVELARIKGAQP